MKQGEGQLIMIPTDTDINCEWQVSPEFQSLALINCAKVDKTNKRLCLQVSTNNSSVVRGVIILADQVLSWYRIRFRYH